MAKEQENDIQDDLLNAMEQSDVEAVKAALAAGGDPNNPFASGQKISAFNMFLMRLGYADSGETPAKDKHSTEQLLEVLKVLKDEGKLDIKIADQESGHKLLDGPIRHFNNYNGGKELIKFLLDNGADATKQPYLNELFLEKSTSTPVSQEKIETAKLLVEHGADLNANDQYGTPLGYAVAFNRPEVAKFLLENGASQEGVGYYSSSNTALAVAAHEGHAEMIPMLAQYGGDPNYVPKNYEGMEIPLAPPLGTVSSRADGNADIIKALIKVGAQITPEILNEFINCDVEKIRDITALFDCGADPNKKDKDGKTALHTWRVKHSDFSRKSDDGGYEPDLRVLELLLKHGADVNAKDVKGRSVLHDWVCENTPGESYRNPSSYAPLVEKLILEHAADPNIQDDNGQTPLHAAAAALLPTSKISDQSAIAALIRHGAKTDIMDNNGKAPKDLISDDSLRKQFEDFTSGSRLKLINPAATNVGKSQGPKDKIRAVGND